MQGQQGMQGRGQGHGQGQGQGNSGRNGMPFGQTNGGQGGVGSGPGAVNMQNPGQPLNPGLYGTRENTRIDPSKASVSIDTNLRGDPNRHEQSSVPYYDVYPEYRNRAESAVNSDQVPVSEKRRVKEYFGALDPSGGR